MKKILSLILCFGLCFITGCSSNDNDYGLKDYPEIEKTNNSVLEDINASPSVKENKPTIEYSETKTNDIAVQLVYKCTGDIKLDLMYNKESSEIMGAKISSTESHVSSDEFMTMASALTYISDFNVDSDIYSQIGDVIQNMEKDTFIDDLVVSCQLENDEYIFYITINK